MVTERIFFENGIPDNVLDEILKSQINHPGKIYYIQPHSSRTISEFRKKSPSDTNKWRLYASLHSDLSFAHYTAEIVGWENKSDISADRLNILNAHMRQFQPSEESIYLNLQNGKNCANLISIKNLRRLDNPIHKSKFYKLKDGTELKTRDRAGNWIYVRLLNEDDNNDYTLKSSVDDVFEKKIEESNCSSQEDRKRRLEVAEKTPTRINVVSQAFKRNPDVVAEALFRSNGKCSLCHKDAPFNKPDGTPYLEVHHWMPLADGGEDTIDNAAALCPNCHKEAHFGANSLAIRESQVK